MTTEAAKELYQHAGMKLRLAREQAGQSIAQMADQTKLTAKVLRELESGEGDIFNTPLYVRGQLRSYARSLGVDIVPDIQQLVALDNPAPVLQVRETTSATSRVVSRAGQYALYFLVTAIVAVPVVSSLNVFRGESQTRPLDGPEAIAEAERVTNELPPTQSVADTLVASNGSAVTTPAAPTTTAVVGAEMGGFTSGMAPTVADPTAGRQPLAASMTGGGTGGITFKFNQDSWVKFLAPDGSVLEQGLISAGTVKQFNVGQIGKARIGAAEQVQMSVNGQPADIAGFTKGSVANFTIGNDGMPSPAANR